MVLNLMIIVTGTSTTNDDENTYKKNLFYFNGILGEDLEKIINFQ